MINKTIINHLIFFFIKIAIIFPLKKQSLIIHTFIYKRIKSYYPLLHYATMYAIFFSIKNNLF